MALLNSNKIATQKNLYDTGYKDWSSTTNSLSSLGNKCVTFNAFNAKDHRDLSIPATTSNNGFLKTLSVDGQSLPGNNFGKSIYIAEITIEPGVSYSFKIRVNSHYYHSSGSGSGPNFKVSVDVGDHNIETITWHTNTTSTSTTLSFNISNLNNEWCNAQKTFMIYLRTSNQSTNASLDMIYFDGSTVVSNISIKDGRKCIMCQTSPGVASAQTVSEYSHKGNPCVFSIFRDNVTFTILSRIYLRINYKLTSTSSWAQTQIADLELGDSSSKIYAGNTESKTFYFPVNPILTGSTGVNECYTSYLILVTDDTGQSQTITYNINSGVNQSSSSGYRCSYSFSGLYKNTIKNITSFKITVD